MDRRDGVVGLVMTYGGTGDYRRSRIKEMTFSRKRKRIWRPGVLERTRRRCVQRGSDLER